MKSYIAYLDMLGTRGFCEDEKVYYENIVNFSKSVETLSPILKNTGKIGMFSDCVYIECNNLKHLLRFLNRLRIMLIGDNLFFNAAVSYGELGVQSIGYEFNEAQSKSNIFGVRFTNKEIASIYCKQTNFRGVGIWLDQDIIEDVKKSGYQVVSSLFYSKREKQQQSYSPVIYYDIPVFENNSAYILYDEKRKKDILAIIFKAIYTSHCKSFRYSIYYISILINIIRCSDASNIKWNRIDRCFDKLPIECELIYNFLISCNKNLDTLIGLDSISFAFLDLVYNSNNFSDYDKISITECFLEQFDFLKKQYKYSLDTIPNEPFTNNNRSHFINYCNTDMALKFVDKVINSEINQ